MNCTKVINAFEICSEENGLPGYQTRGEVERSLNMAASQRGCEEEEEV
jgi:hypothetical protein